MSVKYLAVLVAAIVGIAFCWGYYWLLMNQWLAAAGLKQSDVKNGPPPLAWIFLIVGYLLAGWMLAAVMGYVGPITIRAGIVSGALVWLGFALPVTAINYVFQKRPLELTLIDAGGWLGSLVIMGGVIGAFGK
jgi:hypothetical protein